MKKISALLLGAASLAAVTSLASAARPQHPGTTNANSRARLHRIMRDTDIVTLYDQTDNQAGYGIVSQNFDSSFDQYDSQAADDFVVPVADKGWIIEEVDAPGTYFNGSGPADSVNLFFYSHAKGKQSGPGKLIKSYMNVHAEDTDGSFVIPVPDLELNPGHYWISVQINMDFANGGEWGWELSNVVHGDQSVWDNQGGGFASDCGYWKKPVTCFSFSFNPAHSPDGGGSSMFDDTFALKGKTKGG